MQSQLIAVVLCIFANAASAQCTASTVAPSATAPAVANGIVNVSHVTTTAAAARTGGQLINTAAAGTRDEPIVMRSAGTVRPSGLHANDGDEHKHRNGTAMLLAALALMSGIVLRRSSNNA